MNSDEPTYRPGDGFRLSPLSFPHFFFKYHIENELETKTTKNVWTATKAIPLSLPAPDALDVTLRRDPAMVADAAK